MGKTPDPIFFNIWDENYGMGDGWIGLIKILPQDLPVADAQADLQSTRYPILDSKLRPRDSSYGFINISAWWIAYTPPPPPTEGERKLTARELDDRARSTEGKALDEAALPPLEVEIISGLGLKSMDFMEQSDSYVRVKIGKVPNIYAQKPLTLTRALTLTLTHDGRCNRSPR